MKKMLLICLPLLSLVAHSQITVVKSEGNSVVTELGYGIKVNDGSTLKRERYTINDVNCPIQLHDIGVETIYSDRSYSFKPSGKFSITEPIVAYEIHHLIYNVFGEYIKTLSNQEVKDIDNDRELRKLSSWYASENNVREYFICVSYVANVRTKTNKLWHFNYLAIKEQLQKVKIDFEEDYIPKNEREESK
jgi:hypothetical protein